jgi:hypothetical protein
MHRLQTCLSLTPSDWLLLIQSGLVVAAIRLALWILPFRSWRQILTRIAPLRSPSRQGNEQIITRTAWAVERVSRLVPAATCLTQALSTHVLLRRRGIPTRLTIGVALDRARGFMAHAWVENQGKIVIGGTRLERFTPLLVLEDEIP